VTRPVVVPGEPQQHDPQLETRCHLEFTERHLTFTYVKRDEGFESDTESAKSVEPPSSVLPSPVQQLEVDKTGVEEKIIKDHVFRYAESGRGISGK
jgi:hypothetical protein